VAPIEGMSMYFVDLQLNLHRQQTINLSAPTDGTTDMCMVYINIGLTSATYVMRTILAYKVLINDAQNINLIKSHSLPGKVVKQRFCTFFILSSRPTNVS
jgi:hypothetical protein